MTREMTTKTHQLSANTTRQPEREKHVRSQYIYVQSTARCH